MLLNCKTVHFIKNYAFLSRGQIKKIKMFYFSTLVFGFWCSKKRKHCNMSCTVTICNLNTNEYFIILQVSPLHPLLLKTLFTDDKLGVILVHIWMKSLTAWRNALSAFLYAGKKMMFVCLKNLTPVNYSDLQALVKIIELLSDESMHSQNLACMWA